MAKIVQVSARAVVAYGIEPTARFLLRLGVSPNAVTIVGTLGVLAGAYLGALGHLFWGTWVVTACALTDVLDGTMARMRGGSGKFGALLDSSMDRIADGAVFGAVVYAAVVLKRAVAPTTKYMVPLRDQVDARRELERLFEAHGDLPRASARFRD